MYQHRSHVEIPRELADWMNRELPPEALWEIRPVEPPAPPYHTIAYDVIVTGDRPPQATRAADLQQACRRAVRRYLRHRAAVEPAAPHDGGRP
jgi:hypothetical protein